MSGSTVRFSFRGKSGKSGKSHTIRLKDRRLAKVIARCSELPGHELFQYVDDEGETHSVESSDVNAYLKEIAHADFSAKDFRTWVGTVLAVRALRDLSPAESGGEVTKHVVAAVKQVAERLGNTATVCRKSYIHPAVLDAYSNREEWEATFPKTPTPVAVSDEPELDPDEVLTLTFLVARPSAGDGDGAANAIRRSLQKKLVKSVTAARAKKARSKGKAAA